MRKPRMSLFETGYPSSSSSSSSDDDDESDADSISNFDEGVVADRAPPPKVLTGHYDKTNQWVPGYVHVPSAPHLLIFEAGEELYGTAHSPKNPVPALESLLDKWTPTMLLNVDGRVEYGYAFLEVIQDVLLEPPVGHVFGTLQRTPSYYEPGVRVLINTTSQEVLEWRSQGTGFPWTDGVLDYSPKELIRRGLATKSGALHKIRLLAPSQHATDRGHIEARVAQSRNVEYREVFIVDKQGRRLDEAVEDWDKYSKVCHVLQNAKPDSRIVLHCSAGQGRSGIILALYFAIFSPQGRISKRVLAWLREHHCLPEEAIIMLTEEGYDKLISFGRHEFGPLPGSAFRFSFVDLA